MPNKLQCYIDHFSTIGPYVKLSGWAFVDNAPLRRLSVEAQGTSAIDSIDLISGQARPDVARAFSSETARMSGFLGQGLIIIEDSNLVLKATLNDGSVVEENIGSVSLNEQGSFEFHRDKRRSSNGKLSNLSRLNPSYYAMSMLPGVFDQRRPLPKSSDTPISVLSSVYRGREYLDDFFGSFRRNTLNYAELIIVDNGNESQDLIDYLANAVQHVPRAKLVRVEHNEGYIEGIIRANAARSCDGHVVVLNTDIVLPQYWLERLVWPLDNMRNIATVTPYTNAGTVCSFPHIGIDNLMYLGAQVDEVDRAFQHIDPSALNISIPSGVGYCMAMHKDMLDRIGYFESTTFGLGYGEENDWCLKAEALGWSNILLPNLFVYHKHGGVYPSEQKQSLIQRNLEIICDRYPHYGQAVTDHFSADKNAALREFMAFAIAAHGKEFKVRFYGEQDVAALIEELASDEYCVSFYQHSNQSSWIAILQSDHVRWLLWGMGQDEQQALLSKLYSVCSRQ